MKVLVEYGQSRKVVDIETQFACESLFNTLGVVMGVPFPISNICFQYFDEDFKTWIDLEMGTKIEDKLKLKLTPRSMSDQFFDIPGNCLLNSSTSSDLESESSVEITVGKCDLVGGVVDFTKNELSAEEVKTPISTIETKTISSEQVNKVASLEKSGASGDESSPDIQMLSSKFSSNLQSKLEKKVQLQWAEKHELLNHLGDFLYQKSKYPNMAMKRDISKQLIKQYPHLKERIGSGYDGWTAAFDNKLKSLRMKDPALTSSKMCPTKRKSSAPSKSITKRPSKGEVNFLPPVPPTEDDTSLKRH